MDEYIKRGALMRRIMEIHCAECDSYHGVRCRACWVDDTLDYIDSEPAADVEPVKRGRWIMKKTSAGASYTVCSHCNSSVKYNDEYGTAIMNLKGANYCPNCGARMDEEVKHER